MFEEVEPRLLLPDLAVELGEFLSDEVTALSCSFERRSPEIVELRLLQGFDLAFDIRKPSLGDRESAKKARHFAPGVGVDVEVGKQRLKQTVVALSVRSIRLDHQLVAEFCLVFVVGVTGCISKAILRKRRLSAVDGV